MSANPDCIHCKGLGVVPILAFEYLDGTSKQELVECACTLFENEESFISDICCDCWTTLTPEEAQIGATCTDCKTQSARIEALLTALEQARTVLLTLEPRTNVIELRHQIDAALRGFNR